MIHWQKKVLHTVGFMSLDTIYEKFPKGGTLIKAIQLLNAFLFNNIFFQSLWCKKHTTGMKNSVMLVTRIKICELILIRQYMVNKTSKCQFSYHKLFNVWGRVCLSGVLFCWFVEQLSIAIDKHELLNFFFYLENRTIMLLLNLWKSTVLTTWYVLGF